MRGDNTCYWNVAMGRTLILNMRCNHCNSVIEERTISESAFRSKLQRMGWRLVCKTEHAAHGVVHHIAPLCATCVVDADVIARLEIFPPE